MADLIRQFDWSATPLGAIGSWSPEFLAVLNMALSTPIPAFIYWGPTLTVFYNDAARPITSDKHPHSLGQAAKDVWKEAWHILGPEVEHVLSTGESFHHQQALVPLAINGKLENLYWDYTFSPVFQQSRVAGVLVICQDVSKAVAADRKLRDAEARSKRILQSIGDAVIVTDSNGHITRMNPVAEQLTGWPLSDACDHPLASVFRIVNETTRETVESPADKVLRLRTIVGLANHTILIGKNGTETPIDDSGAPILSDAGELTGTVLVFRDVSERRAAEQQREILALKMQQILEASSDGVAIVNRDWRFTYLNQQGRQILNFTQDPSGQNIWEAFPAMIFPDSPYVLHYHRAMEQGIEGDFLTTYPEPLNISVHILVRPFTDGIIIFFPRCHRAGAPRRRADAEREAGRRRPNGFLHRPRNQQFRLKRSPTCSTSRAASPSSQRPSLISTPLTTNCAASPTSSTRHCAFTVRPPSPRWSAAAICSQPFSTFTQAACAMPT